MDFFSNYLSAIVALCKRHKVSKLFAFGSVLTNRFDKQSDIDLVVDFEGVPLEDYADNYLEFKYALSEMFEREVDLLEDKAIRNPILRRSIDTSKQLIYG
ncbi:nucleotidyltransferase domain-containing protein [Parabacteroides sp. OttesenSCG-928-N08]|nr:nucleotidyltransferase domain-containing protein [Parabacteroides sp. OttesenSCG-928-N08]